MIPILVINRTQPHTQSPAAYVGYFAQDESHGTSRLLWAPGSSTLSLATPSLRVVYQIESSSMAYWEAKLTDMVRLKEGWNGYSAPAPSVSAINTAKSFVRVLMRENQEPRRVAPSAVGGVGVSRRNAKRKVFVEFFNDGKVFALFSDGESEPLSKEVVPGLQTFKNLTREMRDYLDA